MIAPADALDNMRRILSRVNNTIGRYKTLMVLVGTVADSAKLYNQLNCIREKMVDDIKKSRDTFIEYCKSFVVENVSKEQRDLFERLYSFYLTSIEYFMQQLSKCALIIHDFCDDVNDSHVLEAQINTGTYDMPSLVSNQFSNKSLKSSRKSSWDNVNGTTMNNNTKRQTGKSGFTLEECKAIERDYFDLGNILNELHSSIYLSHWNIVPQITVHHYSDDEKGSQFSSDEELEIEEKRSSMDVHRKSGSMRKSKSSTANSVEMNRPSVHLGAVQYKGHPKLLLKSSFWNRRRKVKLVIGIIAALIVCAVVITVPCALKLR